jgi:hypothetical protein
MSQFDVNKWMKDSLLNRHLSESLANELGKVIPEDTSYKDFAQAVAKILREDYGSHNYGPFMEVLHAALGMNESLNEEIKYDTYKVHIVTADPREGGPDEWFDEEVKVDSSLTGDDIKASIKDTIYDMGYRHLYKLNYEKA